MYSPSSNDFRSFKFFVSPNPHKVELVSCIFWLATIHLQYTHIAFSGYLMPVSFLLIFEPKPTYMRISNYVQSTP